MEMEVLMGAIQHVKGEGDFLATKSSSIAKRDSKEIISWSDLHSFPTRRSSDLHSSSFPISKDLYEDWISKNKEPISLTDISEKLKMKSASETEFESLTNLSENKWSILYSFTRPGISDNGDFAIVQLTAFCPSGPPNYGSIFLLEKSGTGWIVKYNYGLYNQ